VTQKIRLALTLDEARLLSKCLVAAVYELEREGPDNQSLALWCNAMARGLNDRVSKAGRPKP
jgi:hypothetical protein